MRVNIYAEEMTDRIAIIVKTIDGQRFTGLRFYLELPVTIGRPNTQQIRGPFIHRPGDDDSSAVTFWGKQDLRVVLRKAIDLLDEHYGEEEQAMTEPEITDALETARAKSSAPEGWRLVPKEMTQKMVDAAGMNSLMFLKRWPDVLAAAPEPSG